MRHKNGGRHGQDGSVRYQGLLTDHDASTERLLHALVVLTIDPSPELAFEGKGRVADGSDEVDLASVTASPQEQSLRLRKRMSASRSVCRKS